MGLLTSLSITSGTQSLGQALGAWLEWRSIINIITELYCFTAIIPVNQIVIQRRLLSLILTTFLPTILMNIIGHMSNYFKEDFFEGLMSMNVTVMLVLTTLFLRKVFLPATHYF